MKKDVIELAIYEHLLEFEYIECNVSVLVEKYIANEQINFQQCPYRQIRVSW